MKNIFISLFLYFRSDFNKELEHFVVGAFLSFQIALTMLSPYYMIYFFSYDNTLLLSTTASATPLNFQTHSGPPVKNFAQC